MRFPYLLYRPVYAIYRLGHLFWESEPPPYERLKISDQTGIKDAVEVALKATDDKTAAQLLGRKGLKEMKAALRVLARRIDLGSMMKIAAFVQTILERMRQRGEDLSRRQLVLTDLPKGLGIDSATVLLSACKDNKWITPKPLAESSGISPATTRRFLHHGHEIGLLYRRGTENLGYDYRWVVLPADRQG